MTDQVDALLADQARLKAQNLVLRKAVIDERASAAVNVRELKEREQQIKKTIQQIDILETHNSSLTRRIEALQSELTQAKKSASSGGWFSANATTRKELDSTKQHLSIVTAELHSKIQQNEKLHHDMYDAVQKKEQDIVKLSSEIHELEAAVQAHQTELSELKASQFEAITQLKSEKFNMERTLFDLRASLKSAQQSVAQLKEELETQRQSYVTELRELYRTLRRIAQADDGVASNGQQQTEQTASADVIDKCRADYRAVFQVEIKLFDLLGRRIGFQLQQDAHEELSAENAHLLHEFDSFSRLSKRWQSTLANLSYPSTAWDKWSVDVARYHVNLISLMIASLSEETSLASDVAQAHSDTFPVTQTLDALRVALAPFESEDARYATVDVVSRVRSLVGAFATHMSKKLHKQTGRSSTTQDIRALNAVIVSTLAQLHTLAPEKEEQVSGQDCRDLAKTVAAYVAQLNNRAHSLQEHNKALQSGQQQSQSTIQALQASIAQAQSEKSVLAQTIKQLEQQVEMLRQAPPPPSPPPLPPRCPTNDQSTETLPLPVMQSSATLTEAPPPTGNSGTQTDDIPSAPAAAAASETRQEVKADSFPAPPPQKPVAKPTQQPAPASSSSGKKRRKKKRQSLQSLQDEVSTEAETPEPGTPAEPEPELEVPASGPETANIATETDAAVKSITAEAATMTGALQDRGDTQQQQPIRVTVDEQQREQIVKSFYEAKIDALTAQLQHAESKSVRYHDAYAQLRERQKATEQPPQQHTRRASVSSASHSRRPSTSSTTNPRKHEETEAQLRKEIATLTAAREADAKDRIESEQSYKTQIDVMSEEIVRLQVRVAELEMLQSSQSLAATSD
ncbi:hypothetical protein RI367_000092 [Sorochytrium milnesiophthora]